MLKLGVISVLNVLPVYYGVLSKKLHIPCELVFDKVTALNRKLENGEIDISAISSFEYAQNPEKYYVFPDLSVSADGPVGSIYLFMDRPIDRISGQTIRLTEFSLTSVHLIQYLLKDFDVHFTQDRNIPNVGELLIADEAIARFYQKKDPFVYDLGELWKQKTGLPFVFALWAVRKDSYLKDAEGVKSVCHGLLRSKSELGSEYMDMAKIYNREIFPSPEECASYLGNLKYELSEAYQEGFMLFQKEMVRLGKLNKVAKLEFLQL